VWTRESGGLVLTFHLAGINNQNFLMRDDQTGSYWQQITGAAVFGPLRGRHLTLVASDELSFGLWAAEEPSGTVLKDVAKYVPDYAKKDWEVRIKKDPTVLSFADPALGLEPRSLMLGVHGSSASRAFLFDAVLRDKLVLDHVGSEPVLVTVGPDGQSVRVFRDRIPSIDGDPAFYRIFDDKQSRPNDATWLKQAVTAPLLIDETTGSQWNFQGCAVSGKLQGSCLEPITAIKDYWFDWRNYNPNTTVYTGQH
jgi:Protein of unknown function (DUF3179)